ncbi:MAG TPA: hypothetical protein VMW10_04495 [Alphaproteobacteria bacterium]|nr:hypothetical protein [Alphaproteobacteria bacterium]
MRTLFLILLGLSLLTIERVAAYAPRPAQKQVESHSEKVGPVCDPHETSKMPETFY